MEGQGDYSTKDSDVATDETLIEPDAWKDIGAIGKAHRRLYA
jgi:hypothetical protein